MERTAPINYHLDGEIPGEDPEWKTAYSTYLNFRMETGKSLREGLAQLQTFIPQNKLAVLGVITHLARQGKTPLPDHVRQYANEEIEKLLQEGEPTTWMLCAPMRAAALKQDQALFA